MLAGASVSIYANQSSTAEAYIHHMKPEQPKTRQPAASTRRTARPKTVLKNDTLHKKLGVGAAQHRIVYPNHLQWRKNCTILTSVTYNKNLHATTC